MKHKDCFFIALLILSPAAYPEDAKDLFAAAMTGRLERTEALLAQGVDGNSKTSSGRTALMAAGFSGNVHIVKALLAYGVDVNIADNSGTTALMDAVVFGNEEIVNLLITAGADVNALDKQNVTVMARAKKIAHEKIIKILEKAGAKDAPEAPIEDAAAKENAGAKPAEKPEEKK
jgi:ankyrin repeat protein